MRRMVAVTALLALLLGGCGIPENSDVTVLGPGPLNGQPAREATAPLQGTRDSTTDPAQFVDNYLRAAAGDPEGALGRAKAFMAENVANAFKAGPDVRIIRLAEQPLYTPGNPEITVRAQQVGLLKSNGSMEPATDPSAPPATYTLRVISVAGKGLFLTQVPPVLLLTDTALNDYYVRRTIYFWNTEQTGLVPDLRYMPSSVPTVQQPTRILGWLANGPVTWLSDRVQTLPLGTVEPENVPAITKETLQVKLSANAVPPGDARAQERLRRQLQWSLRPLLPRVMELKIGQDSVKYSGTDYLTSNPSSRLADSPERFVIFNGVVRRHLDAPHFTDPVPVLRSADNKNILAATMSASATHVFGAVLLPGAGKRTRLRVSSAPIGEQSALHEVTGLAGTLGRPVWAVNADGDPNGAVGLITANGRLYSFSPKGGRARPVDWQAAPSDISALAVAPDEHRLALVAKGKLYRTMLGFSGDTITIGKPEQLSAPTLKTVSAVAWSGEDWLVVAGVRADRRVSIMDLTVDGALQQPRLADIGDKAVTSLTAYPADPTEREKSFAVTYTAGGAGWDAFTSPLPIIANQLAGVPENSSAGGTPTAPFFLD